MYSPKAPSPFKFLDSYTKADREIFFGRDREIEEMYGKVFQSKIMLVYGASGTGKSSIINCGLANKFKDSDWLPIHIRRGGNILRSMYQQIRNEAITPVTRVNEEKIVEEDLRRAVNSVYLDHFKPLYLIFDQFEELFIFGFKEEWEEFIRSVKFLIETDLEVRFIFVIRGEYLEFLSEFEEMIPNFFDNRVRIEKMTRNEALQSITGPCELFNIGLEEGFEEKLLKKISPEKSEIELTFLQVYLDRVYKNAIQNSEETNSLTFTNEEIDQIGQIGDVLAEFLDEQLFKLEDSKAGLTILKSFVSMEGTKQPRKVEEIDEFCRNLGYPLTQDQINEILITFVNKRILKDPNEEGYYELRHDSLALKIYEKITHQEKELIDVRQFLAYSLNEFQKRGTLLKDEDLTYFAPFERAIELDEETQAFIDLSKKKSNKRKLANRRRTAIFIVIIVLLITSVFGFINSQRQKSEAERLALIASEESERAQQQSEIAERQREIADQQALLASLNADSAANAAQIAEEQRKLAELQRREAEYQRSLAQRNFTTAEEQRQLAEYNAEQALLQEQRALENLELAETERERALTLRMQAMAQAVAVKSTQLFDPQLKGLLALHAYDFNKDYEGNPYHPDIYSGLYQSLKAIKGEEYNSSKLNEGTGRILRSSSRYFYRGTRGNIYELKISGSIRAEQKVSTNQIITAFDITTDVNTVIIGSDEGTITSYNIESGKSSWTEKIHEDEITGLKILNGTIVTSSLDGTIKQTQQGTSNSESIDIGESVSDMALGQQLYVATSLGSVFSVDLESREAIKLYESREADISRILVTEENIILGYESGLIRVLDSTGAVVKNLFGHKARISDLNFNGEFLLSSAYDRTALAWNFSQLDLQPLSLSDHDNWVLTGIFTSENQLITGEFDGTIKTYTINPATLATELCSIVNRQLNEEEWNEFIADDVAQKPACR